MFQSSQQGISLLLAIFVLALISAVVLGISTILLQETKIAREIGNSVVAFYAAETGIEQILMTKQSPVTACIESSPCPLTNGAVYYLSITPAGANCSGQNYCLKSIGIFKGTRRGIEVNY